MRSAQITGAHALAAALVCALAVLTHACAVSADVTPPLTGDWVIEQGESVELTGEVAVPASVYVHGTLTLTGCTLTVPGSVHLSGTGTLSLTTPRECMDFLLAKPRGTATMLLLQRVHAGRATLLFKDGLSLEMEFSAELFPTFGIWWNHVGYPDEHGGLRMECAFEPIPGASSSLAEVLRRGAQLTVEPHGHTAWSITWRMSLK